MRALAHICLWLYLTIAGTSVLWAQPQIDSAYIPLAEFLSRSDASLTATAGNDINLITKGIDKWDLLLKDLEEAQHTICMEYYRWHQDDAGDQIRDVLLRKLSQGVTVKILLDDFVNPFYRKDYYLVLRDNGAQLQFFTDTDRQLWEIAPEVNYRDHRKIVVIDDTIGYIGGMNLGVKYRDIWKDTHMRICGPAALALKKLFDDMWQARQGPALKRYLAKGQPKDQHVGYDGLQAARQTQVSPTSPLFCNKTVQVATSGQGDNLLEEGICRILDLAKHYVYFKTPYLCPSDTLLCALRDAARRGVDIRILVPDPTDSGLMTVANSAFFSDCIDAGARVLKSHGVFDHSKTIVSDDYLTSIGTLNIDNRSLRINHECIALIYDGEIARYCRQMFEADAGEAFEVTAADLAARSKCTIKVHRFWRMHASQL